MHLLYPEEAVTEEDIEAVTEEDIEADMEAIEVAEWVSHSFFQYSDLEVDNCLAYYWC